MIFSQTLITSKRWFYLVGAPILVALALWAHGASLGLTDDEAYYWVLAQKPALTYAYHPPAVAWFIAFFQKLFFNHVSSGVVRFPAVFCVGWVLSLTMGWFKRLGWSGSQLRRTFWILFSLAGFSALGWMMVPDLPLFLGWTLVFVSTWEVCFSEKVRKRFWAYAALGALLSILSKYSGVLILGSAGLAILFWAPRKRKKDGILILLLGFVSGLVPILIWNAQHQWASILYQIRDRHQGEEISLLRLARFWGISILVMGPALFWASLRSVRETLSSKSRELRYFWIFTLPPLLIFGIQPLFSDFKPHWALVAWWPLTLALAWSSTRGSSRLPWVARVHCIYGTTLLFLVYIACHVPLQAWATEHLFHHAPNPLFDVTNDMTGWNLLPSLVQDPQMPVVGSRYQTAAQAAFSLGSLDRVTMVPREIRSWDEWPDLQVTQSPGPDWTPLLRPVLYVADNRYDLSPQFPGAHCEVQKTAEAYRESFLGTFFSKKIVVYLCKP